MKLVFDINIETFRERVSDIRIIASAQDSAVIQKILACLDDNATSAAQALLPYCHDPPTTDMFV